MSRVPRDNAGTSGSARTVLFIDDTYTFGGAIVSLARLVKGLNSFGVRSVVLSRQSTGTLDRLFGDMCSTVQQKHVSSDRRPFSERIFGDHTGTWSLIDWILHQVDNLDRLLTEILPTTLHYMREAQRHEADIIHLNNGIESQLPGVYASRLLGIPCVVHTRNFPGVGRGFGRLTKKAVGDVNRFIAVSASVKVQLVENGVPEQLVSVVHNAVDVERFSEARSTGKIREGLGIPAGAKVFGLVGRMLPWKGVKEFVAAGRLVLRNVQDAYAVIVGDESDGDPTYYEEVRASVQRSAVKDRILFTGYRDDIPEVLSSLDLLVHTSIAPEPFGLVLVEAMAAGKPVVAADRGGPLEIIEDGRTGYLADPEDPKAVARYIYELLLDETRAQRFGERGQERARQKFSIERYSREVADIYKEVLNQSIGHNSTI